ncbi:hypothetical protein FAES_2940 [Fibrella aestuarina BUZ 2]|uniref:DUF4403 family protein n=1 Tax=Fibrella aestuarina BUZ 2 TaxID=1166018 RepID=I0K9Z6_9BACT|nr:DUF4403 family protein [Fibrella aestuarina]CCH00949.1 hypothetical protein FAES_2940 [Fibrella aestuarina BUZ 2]
MNPQRTIQFVLILLVVSLAVSCKKVKPKPPAAEGFDDEIPPAISFLAGPISFNIRALEDQINKALKPELVRPEMMKDQKGAAMFNLRVYRTGRVKIKYANNKVSFSAPLQVWIDNPLRLNKRKHSKNALCALAVDFQSPLQVSPNWRLSTKAKFTNYTWIEKPKLRILGVNISVTRLVENLLEKRRPEIEEVIDKAVHNELRLDRQVRPIWKSLQKPLLLVKSPDSIWLVPTPFSVAVGEVTGNATTLTVPIRVAFSTRTEIGKRPDVDTNGQLPHLRKARSIRQTSDLRVMSFITYDDMNRVLAKTLQGHNLGLAGGMVKIKRARVYGGQKALIIRTDVGGAVNGTLYFRGQPAYDTLTHTLRIKNIDFDVETEERLLATADWLLHDRLKDTLSKVLHIPLREQILKLPTLIDRAFENSRTGVKNDLDILSFRFVPQRIAIRPTGIQSLLKVETNVRLEVKKL